MLSVGLCLKASGFSALGLEQRQRRFFIHRSADQIALDFVAIGFFQVLKLPLMLDSFRYDTVTELVGHADDVTGYRLLISECHKLVDEGLVNLQTVDVQLPLAGEG